MLFLEMLLKRVTQNVQFVPSQLTLKTLKKREKRQLIVKLTNQIKTNQKYSVSIIVKFHMNPPKYFN